MRDIENMLKRQDALQLAFTVCRVLSEHVQSDMPWHQGYVFLVIARADPEGVVQSEIGRITGLSTSSVSRNIAALSHWHRLKRPGLGLVEHREDYRDRRVKPVFLTDKGRVVRDKIVDAISRQLSRDGGEGSE